MSAKLNNDFLEAYMTAGKSTVIVKSKTSHYSYNIRDWEKVPGMYFASYHGTETYKIGYFQKRNDKWCFVFKGNECPYPSDHAAIRAFRYLIEVLLNRQGNPFEVEVWHDGACAKCGRQLKDPESIDRGFGPDCFKALNK
jgi:hypothetical protein